MITAARFTSDGKYAVAGLFRGQVYFYDADGLKYYTQIACRNRSGKHRMGKQNKMLHQKVAKPLLTIKAHCQS